MLGKTSKHQVFLVSGQATRKPLAKGECRITARTSYREARSIVGTVPIDWPYSTILSVLKGKFLSYLGSLFKQVCDVFHVFILDKVT